MIPFAGRVWQKARKSEIGLSLCGEWLMKGVFDE
jgi:hypothetical protein